MELINRWRVRIAMWLSPYDALAYRLHVSALDFHTAQNVGIVECRIEGRIKGV